MLLFGLKLSTLLNPDESNKFEKTGRHRYHSMIQRAGGLIYIWECSVLSRNVFLTHGRQWVDTKSSNNSKNSKKFEKFKLSNIFIAKFKHLSGSFGPAGQWSLGKVSLGLSKRQPKYECTYKMKPDSLPRMTALTEQLTNMANGIYCILWLVLPLTI